MNEFFTSTVSAFKPSIPDVLVPKLLVIDNYDSFTFNLIQMFMHYNLEIVVKRNDKITIKQVKALKPDYILISPGPKSPSEAGISIPLIKTFYQTVPILGVCLGMQCINEAFGGLTTRAPLPVHGKTSNIYHENSGIFSGIPSPFIATRYHSLMIKTNVGPFLKTAYSSDNVIMGIEHPQYPLWGVQFHPESFLTQYGFYLIENFLKTI